MSLVERFEPPTDDSSDKNWMVRGWHLVSWLVNQVRYQKGMLCTVPSYPFLQVRYLNDVSILDTLLETEKKALAKAGAFQRWHQ